MDIVHRDHGRKGVIDNYFHSVREIFRSLKIRYKFLISFSTIFFLFMLLCSLVVYLFLREHIEENIESELNNTTQMIHSMVKTSATVSIKNYLRAVAEKNREIVASIYQQTLDEDLTVSQAKQKAADILLSQTIGNSGYIYCVNSVGTVLSPVKFLNRSAEVFPDKLAVIYGEQRYTYAQFQKRVFRLASALKKNNIGKGDKVAFICPNTPPMLEAHFAVPMIGAALVSVNIRLAAPEIAYIVDHSDAKALFVDNEFGTIVASIQSDLPKVKTYVNICDVDDTTPLDGPNYETFIATGSEAPVDIDITDEKDIMTINYTSGTTGKPKGVMYHHRGAYINALGELLEFNIRPESLYLWSFIFRDKKHLP